MTTGKGRDLDFNSKSEKIVRLTLMGYKPKEIAKMLNIPRGTVRQLLWKRRNLTRKFIAIVPNSTNLMEDIYAICGKTI